MREFERLIEVYNDFKKTAEQKDFLKIIMMDAQIAPYYVNLKEEYTEEHEQIFCDIMRNKIFPIFKIKEN